MKTTPHGGFSANEMYDMLREGDFVVKEIPKGQKNNCYTIIDVITTMSDSSGCGASGIKLRFLD
jgi:hypothetical protein